MFGKNNAAFRKRAIMLLVIGFLCYYLFCVITGEQMNAFGNIMAPETGWDMASISNMLTIGSLIAVVMILVINTLFLKFDSKKLMVGTTFIVAIGVFAIGLSSKIQSFVTFAIALIIIRTLIVILQHGTNFMCQNWWSENRGKALGLVTIGGPVASATFVAITTLANKGGMKFAGIYTVFAIVIAVIGVIMAIFYKSSPESCGLFPDGAEEAPLARRMEENESTMSIMDVLKNKDSWLIIISFGILYFGITCITAYFAIVMGIKEVDTSIYLPALTVGALVGIPVSFGLGVIDDKWGTPVASIVMCVFYIIGFLGMAFSSGAAVGFIVMATIGYAAITGGCPNLNPSINAYVFGHKNFLATSRVIMAAQGIIAAFAPTYMGAFLAKGNVKGAYFGLIIAVIVAIILLAILARKPAYDSDEAVKAREAASAE